jgi:hypothetical protein
MFEGAGGMELNFCAVEGTEGGFEGDLGDGIPLYSEGGGKEGLEIELGIFSRISCGLRALTKLITA